MTSARLVVAASIALMACKGPPRGPYVDILDAALTLGCGQTSTLTVDSNRDVAFTSDDPAVADVDDQGRITPGHIGATTVRAEWADDPSVFDEVEVTVTASLDVYVDAAAAAGGDGSPSAPLRYVTTDPVVLCPGGTVHLAAGVYEQRLGLGGTVTLVGPDAWPPTAVIRPYETDFPGAVIGVQGGEQGAVVTLENLHVDGSAVADPPFAPTSFHWFRGLMLDGNVEAVVRGSLFTGFAGESPGDDNGICVHAIDSTVTIEDSELRDCGWRAVATMSYDGDPASRVVVVDSAFSGSDPALSGVSATQTAIWAHEGATGEVTGSTFSGFGPAAAPSAAHGGARVTGDGAVGWALDLPASGFAATGNTFEDVQGVFRARGAGAWKAGAFLAANTVDGPTILPGPAAEAAEVRGWLDADPNQLNAVLLGVPCETLSACEVTLSPGAFALTEDLVDPEVTVTLVSSGATTVTIPNGSVPAHVVGGAGVTITPTP